MGCGSSLSFNSSADRTSEFSQTLQVAGQQLKEDNSRGANAVAGRQQMRKEIVGNSPSSEEHSSSGVKTPKRKVGFLMKQGHNVKNWKRRFFVLDQGKLTYYTDRSKRNREMGTDEKGKLLLHDYVVIKGFTGKNNKSILLSHKESPDKDYLLEATSPEERAEWDHALSAHIKYACYILIQKQKGYSSFENIY